MARRITKKEATVVTVASLVASLGYFGVRVNVPQAVACVVDSMSDGKIPCPAERDKIRDRLHSLDVSMTALSTLYENNINCRNIEGQKQDGCCPALIAISEACGQKINAATDVSDNAVQ